MVARSRFLRAKGVFCAPFALGFISYAKADLVAKKVNINLIIP